VPYRTSYYDDAWGFCLAHHERLALAQRGEEEQYNVVIDTELIDGSLTFGEFFLPGESADEVLFSCHVCHPSLANDNLSGIAVATFLARHLTSLPRHYSYRFLFLPATIGALVWLSSHENELAKIKHGLVLALLGDAAPFTYKRSRLVDAEIDRVVAYVLRQSAMPHRLLDFEPFGYDERQYCSPGINLPMGCLMRSLPGEYAEYHTSADNLDLVRSAHLAESLSMCQATVDVLERNRTYVSLNPRGEPQLGRRGLYRALGGEANRGQMEAALLWVLNLADGEHSLLAVAERAGVPFNIAAQAAELLKKHGLIELQS
jgi:aminopeptidase-like protein